MTFAGRVEARFTVPAGVSILATNTGVGGGASAVSITAGTYFISDLCAHVAARLNAVRTPATWTVTLDTLTGKVSINWTGAGGTTFSIAWTSTALRDVLGFAADIVTAAQGVASVSPMQARGLWIPNHPLNSDVDSKQAPTETDQRDVETPSGDVVSLAGNRRYVHTNLMWEHVPINKVWISEEIVANESYEKFYTDAIDGSGNAWFTTGSPLRIYDHRAAQLGQTRGSISWKLSGCPNLSILRMTISRFAGYTKIVWPRLLSTGS